MLFAQFGDGMGTPLMQALRDLGSGLRRDVLGGGLDRGGGVAGSGKYCALRIGRVLQSGAAARIRLAREQRLRETLRPAERIGAFHEFQNGFGSEFESPVNDTVVAGHDDARDRDIRPAAAGAQPALR